MKHRKPIEPERGSASEQIAIHERPSRCHAEIRQKAECDRRENRQREIFGDEPRRASLHAVRADDADDSGEGQREIVPGYMHVETDGRHPDARNREHENDTQPFRHEIAPEDPGGRKGKLRKLHGGTCDWQATVSRRCS